VGHSLNFMMRVRGGLSPVTSQGGEVEESGQQNPLW
jgi:hypothetical protein